MCCEMIFEMKKEVIELEAMWFGGGFHFRLADDKIGLTREIQDGFEEFEPYKIEDGKIVYFWKKVEELGVWSWKKNIPIGSKNLLLGQMVVLGHLS